MYACYAMASMLSDQGMAILLLIGRTSGGGTEVLLLLHACSTPVVSAVTGKSWQLRDQLIRMMVTWDRDCSSVLLGWVAAGSGATMLYVMMVCCLKACLWSAGLHNPFATGICALCICTWHVMYSFVHVDDGFWQYVCTYGNVCMYTYVCMAMY